MTEDSDYAHDHLQIRIPRTFWYRNVSNLPTFAPVSHAPNTNCFDIDPNSFTEMIDEAYNRTIKWRKNLFKLPTGNASKLFIKELSFWLQQFNQGTEFQGIAIKVYMLLPSVLLQKPSANSKAKDHLAKLESRLKLWKSGHIHELLLENALCCYWLNKRTK